MTVASAKVVVDALEFEWFVELSMHPRDQAEHLLDAAELWSMWGDERGDTDFDLKGYMNEYLGPIREGSCCIVVVYDGERPVAMTTLHRNYDASASRIRVVGERLYVAPAYRKTAAFSILEDALNAATWLMGAAEQVLSAPADAPKLIERYEAMGFKASDLIMKRLVAND